MKHFYQDLPHWFNFQDVYQEAIERAPFSARFLEVGVHYGASAAFMVVEALHSGKQIHLDMVDPWTWPDDVYVRLTAWIVEHGLEELVTPLRGTTLEVSKVLPWWGRYDFIFIDGDHSYQGILNDLVHWWPRLKKGGWMAGHDLGPQFPGVEQALCEFLGKEGRSFFEPVSVNSWRIKSPKS